jgi:hypothetical protein
MERYSARALQIGAALHDAKAAIARENGHKFRKSGSIARVVDVKSFLSNRMSRAQLARLVLQMLASGDTVPPHDALQLRNWAKTPDDAMLAVEEIALRIPSEGETGHAYRSQAQRFPLDAICRVGASRTFQGKLLREPFEPLERLVGTWAGLPMRVKIASREI